MSKNSLNQCFFSGYNFKVGSDFFKVSDQVMAKIDYVFFSWYVIMHLKYLAQVVHKFGMRLISYLILGRLKNFNGRFSQLP